MCLKRCQLLLVLNVSHSVLFSLRIITDYYCELCMNEEACGRIEDSCMVQNSIRLYLVMSILLFRIVIDTCKTYLFVNRKYNIISITGLFHVLILVPFFVESLVELRTKCIQLQIRIVSRFYNQDII